MEKDMSSVRPENLTTKELLRYAYLLEAKDANLLAWVRALTKKLEEAEDRKPL
jgi:succinate dehydrogenase flavin-adding protein (antitoxin of CptAB toxin-antitoxin module)